MPATLDVHLVMDNYATHKTKPIRDRLLQTPAPARPASWRDTGIVGSSHETAAGQANVPGRVGLPAFRLKAQRSDGAEARTGQPPRGSGRLVMAGNGVASVFGPRSARLICPSDCRCPAHEDAAAPESG